ncbi:MAG: hypothetical protein A3K67_04620 [Euryarchaeota archaeon RBG_16_62_10]|nr:MAG: hypothetical protein A3K67_04620 [Euryarchaeota archaeon RBG_16_62_10]
MKDALGALLRPSSVALIGASANPAKLGHVILKNLSEGRFRLYPVNPKSESILGLRCYPTVLDIPGKVDLAVLSLPAEACVPEAAACVEKGVRVVAVTSSGFGESGAKGRRLEERLVSTVKGSDTRLLGPNTMGAFVPSIGLDTLFIPREKSPRPEDGSIAMLSQSGAVSVAFLEKAAASGIGVSACVGLGNKADIGENDLVQYFSEDRRTKCLALYLESFSDGRRFVQIAKDVTRSKPVVVLKSGRTSAGARAARSHTGAIATSSDALVDGALAQAGVIRAYDEQDLMDVAKALAYSDRIEGDRICVVASAGGFGVIASDYVTDDCQGAGLRMARLSRRSEQALARVVPGFASIANPVDLTAGVTDEMYDAVLGIVQADPGVDGVMMSLELQPPNITKKLVGIAARRARSGRAPIVVSAFGGERTAGVLREFESRGVPAYPTIWRAVRALGALSERGHHLRRRK